MPNPIFAPEILDLITASHYCPLCNHPLIFDLLQMGDDRQIIYCNEWKGHSFSVGDNYTNPNYFYYFSTRFILDDNGYHIMGDTQNRALDFTITLNGGRRIQSSFNDFEFKEMTLENIVEKIDLYCLFY